MIHTEYFTKTGIAAGIVSVFMVAGVLQGQAGPCDFDSALPPEVTIQSYAHPGWGLLAPSYLDMTLSGDTSLDGQYDGWCVRVGINLGSAPFVARPVCSYDSSVDTAIVDRPENLDLVNWLLNEVLEGNIIGKLSGCLESGVYAAYTYSDVQRAIWQLIDNDVSTHNAALMNLNC